MADFDKLNKETREYNSRVHEYYNYSIEQKQNPISAYWLNYYNNQTYKQNNGQYSSHY